MKRPLLLVLLIISCFDSTAQNRLTARKDSKVHELKLPQRMQITYGDGISNYFEVTGVNPDGLNTEVGPIPFSDIQAVNAVRYKDSGVRTVGILMTVLGAVSVITGIVFLNDDEEGLINFGSGPGYGAIAVGAGLMAGGVLMISARRKYDTEKWELETLMAQGWGKKSKRIKPIEP